MKKFNKTVNELSSVIEKKIFKKDNVDDLVLGETYLLVSGEDGRWINNIGFKAGELENMILKQMPFFTSSEILRFASEIAKNEPHIFEEMIARDDDFVMDVFFKPVVYRKIVQAITKTIFENNSIEEHVKNICQKEFSKVNFAELSKDANLFDKIIRENKLLSKKEIDSFKNKIDVFLDDPDFYSLCEFSKLVLETKNNLQAKTQIKLPDFSVIKNNVEKWEICKKIMSNLNKNNDNIPLVTM